jgi:hypothetical protein
MTKSELIEMIARKQKHLPAKDVELAVKHLLDLMSDSLARGERIEIAAFQAAPYRAQPEDRRSSGPFRQIRTPLQAGQGPEGEGQRQPRLPDQ